MTMKILQDDLPLFPLNTVLFPQARLPLSIFEPRYREMIQRCLEHDLAFGVVLIKEGVEVGGPAIPYGVGTIARIVDAARLDDGRYNIITAGVTRFILQQSFTARAYMTGRIRLLPEASVSPSEVAPLVERVTKLFARFVRQFQVLSNTSAADEPKSLELPSDPTILSYWIGAALPINERDKQTLLETQMTAARLQREIAFIERERALLRLVSTRDIPVPEIGAFSAN